MAPKPKGKVKKTKPPQSLTIVPRVHVPQPVHVPNSELVLTIQHSLEIVKTVITATMLEIIFIRHVFPDHDWQNYAWDPADPSISYKSFIEGVEGKNRPNFEATDNLMVWHFPKRGTTPGLDKLLDCLESGAQDALTKGYLHKLNLSIARVDDGPITESNLIESYTIKFLYESGNIVSQIYSETGDTNSRTTIPAVLLDAKNGARKLLNNVASFLWNSSKHGELKDYPLPPSFRMIMAMDYVDGTPSDYQAPRFHQGDGHAARLINLGHLNGNRVMSTGFHSVAVGWHLPGVHEQPAQTGHYHLNGDAEPSGITRHVRNPDKYAHARQHSALSEIEGGHTQPEAMRQIGGMGAFREPNTDTQDTRPLQSPSASATTQTSAKRRRTRHSRLGFTYPPYTQSIIDLLERQEDINNKPVNVACDCGAEDDTEDLIHCLKCRSSQHAQCYGYHDGNHPSIVMCYHCLLHPDEGPNEEELYQEMQHMCVKRRLLYYLLEYGPTAHIEQLKEYIGHEEADTVDYMTQLEREGYVLSEISVLNGEKSVPSYTLLADEENIRSNYFRPQQKISHHFALPESPSSARFNETTSVVDQSGRQDTPLTEQNLSDSQRVTRATRRRLLAEASSTQDTSSYQSESGGSPRNLNLDKSPRSGTPAGRPGSSTKKRPADSDIVGVPPKRPHLPVTSSPWILRIDDGRDG